MERPEIDLFLPATEMLRGLRDRRWSSSDLVGVVRKQVERHNSALNALIIDRLDQAEKEAGEADRRRAEGDSAPLLGLPVTIKESIEVAGGPACHQRHARAQ